MTNTEFVGFVADNQEYGPESIDIESEIDSLKKEYETGGEGITHQIMKTTRAQFDGADISLDNEHIIEGLKDRYRNQLPVS